MMQWTWRSEADAESFIGGINGHEPGTLSRLFGSFIPVSQDGTPAPEKQDSPSILSYDSDSRDDRTSEAGCAGVSRVTFRSRILGPSRVGNPDLRSSVLGVETPQGRHQVRESGKTRSLARNYKRQEPESVDEDELESDVESDDEAEPESDGDEIEAAGPSKGVTPGSTATNSAIPVLDTEIPTAANLDAASTADLRSNPLPTLQHHPERLAIVISGVIVIVVCLASVLTCLLIRWKKKRNGKPISSPYAQLRQLHLLRPGTRNNNSEKRSSSSLESPEVEKPLPWDPASSFARPLSKPPKRPVPTLRRMFNPLGSHPLSGENPSPPGEEEPKTPGSTTRGSVRKMMDSVIQAPARVRTPSSTALPREQHPSPPSRSIPTPRTPRFISKFSFSSTPRSSGITTSTWGNGMRRSYLSRTSDNDGGTVYTSDSEPPRFRTVSSWVEHQQSKSLKKQHLQPLESEETLQDSR